MKLSPDGSILYVTAVDGTLTAYDPDTGLMIWTYSPYTSGSDGDGSSSRRDAAVGVATGQGGVAFTPDGMSLVYAIRYPNDGVR